MAKHIPSKFSISTNRSKMTANTDEEMGHECVSKNQCLSTVLKFDQENNIFGLANDPVLNNYTIHKKISKPDRKPVFYQTPIVLHCCPVVCYQNKSKSDMPMSLKCRKCFLCTQLKRKCTACGSPTRLNRCPPPCPTTNSACDRYPKCNYVDCFGRCCGMKIVINRKKEYPPALPELMPKASCELHKPLAARKCTHSPRCVGPTACFPYLMPCYWPGRRGAPCTQPGRCFHNPPCPPPRNKYPCDRSICEKVSAFSQQVQTPCKDCPNMPKSLKKTK